MTDPVSDPVGKAGKKLDPEAEAPWGSLLDTAPKDWQILQQDAAGRADMVLAGRWTSKAVQAVWGEGGIVQVRLAREETGAPLPGFSWTEAETRSDGTWSLRLAGVPAGGPYRLETRFNPRGNKLGEWSLRGDMRHFLGVGDIWVVAGQSNATGYGRAPIGDGPEIGLHQLRQSGTWSLASHPLHDGTDTSFPANRELYNAGHSPFLHFARLLRRELGHPIALLPAGLGGSALEAWRPEDGPLFRNLSSMVARAGGKVRGMAWIQGESDAEPGRAETYLERFLAASDGWRGAFANPDFPGALPLLTVQLGRYRSRNPGEEDQQWSQVREAQRRAPRMREFMAVVPALDLPLDDTIHFGSAGNLILADRLARAALATAYGRPDAQAAPNLEEATLKDERGLELRFAPLSGRLDTHHPAARPFRVEDAEGPVPVVGTVYYRRDTVRLLLSRPAREALSVSAGYGEDPDTLPVDTGSGTPILAFHAVPVPFHAAAPSC